MTDLYKREELSPSEQKGFDQAKHLHSVTGCIHEVREMFHGQPASKFANGGMKYVNNQLMRVKQ